MVSRGKLLVHLALTSNDAEYSNSLNNAVKESQQRQNIISENNVVTRNTETASTSGDSLLNSALSEECLFEDDNILLLSNSNNANYSNSCYEKVNDNTGNIESLENVSFATLEPVQILYSQPVEDNLLNNVNMTENKTGSDFVYEELTDPTWHPQEAENCSASDGSDSEHMDVFQVADDMEVQEENIDEAENKKRKRNPKDWSRNVRKMKRNSGVAHTNSRKKEVSKRKMLDPCKETCMFKCAKKISQKDRMGIFQRFWGMADLQNQRQYILKCLTRIPHTNTLDNNLHQRTVNHAFYFECNETNIRVCKVFFTHTLGISDRVVRTVIDKTKDGVLEEDKRGKHGMQPKLEESVKEGIREHINSIPRIESHYLRAQTSRQFISGSKTLAEIHRDYVKKCEAAEKAFGNYTMFSRIFSNNFNISFFTPKKDLCGTCEQFKNSSEIEKKELQQKYDQHLKEKELSRLEKEKDKELARAEECITACFDLQAVLQTPNGEVNTFYYKSKLSTYNFTIFDIGHCYVWHEGEGNRGANEIGTCLLSFLKLKESNIPIILYCDNCCGQNKNKYIACMLLYAVMNLKIPSICLKFLVVGHTQNEGDNMHSLIEKQKKRVLKSGPIYTPAQWIPVIANAKKTGTPYKITKMEYSDFYDMKLLQEYIGSNFAVNDNGGKVLWHDIAVMKFLKEEPFSIYYKTSYEEREFKKIVVRKTGRVSTPEIKLKQLYKTPIKISQTKIEALTDLCNKNHIKPKYHEFYKSLGCNINPAKAKEEAVPGQSNNNKLKKKTTTLKNNKIKTARNTV